MQNHLIGGSILRRLDMAGTLYEIAVEMVLKLDVYAAALSAAKAGAGAAGGYFLKRLGGVFVSGTDKCVIGKCVRHSYKMGLCMQCYSKAKSKVEREETDWDKLAQLGLCKIEGDPFDDAYSRAMEDN